MSLIRRMFSKPETSTGGSFGSPREGKKSASKRGRKGKLLLAQAEEEVKEHEGVVKRTMDEESFASGMPTNSQGLADKLDSHRSGTLFKYAVITNKPSDERQSMLSKLRSFKPQTKTVSHTLNDIPAVRLIGDFTELNLTQVLNPGVLGDGKDFLLIDCILVHFVPLDSFANDKSVVTVQVNDFRKTSNTVARTAKVDNTMGYNILFFLDYCVETKDASKMTLSFSCSTKEFQEGVSWGTVKVVAQLQLLSFPRRMPLVGTMGVMLLSDTDLDDFECDPREIDLVLTPEVIKRLKEANRRGEIENKTIAQSDRKEIMTAKTVLGEQYEQEDVGSVIGRMKEMALLRERQQAAQKANKERLSRIQGDVGSERTEEMDSDVREGRTNGMTGSGMELSKRVRQEVDPSESMSQQGDTESEIGRSLEVVKGTKTTRFVD
jgi:hypothetical protein